MQSCFLQRANVNRSAHGCPHCVNYIEPCKSNRCSASLEIHHVWRHDYTVQYAHRCLGVSVFRGSMFLTWRFIYSGEVKRSGKGQNASGLFSTGDGDTPVHYPAGLRACIWGLSYVSEWVSKDFAAYDTWCVHGTQACW